MRVLIYIYNWFLDFFSKKHASTKEVLVEEVINVLSYSYVIDLPDVLKSKQIYILKDGIVPELLAFKCPCGCNQDIILNLLKDTTPKWDFDFTLIGEINIYPSIWRSIDCKSHFFIRKSKVVWTIQ